MLGNGNRVLTIGHSTMALETFIAILKKEGVTAVADVRSAPFSRRVPHFSRDRISRCAEAKRYQICVGVVNSVAAPAPVTSTVTELLITRRWRCSLTFLEGLIE